MNKHSIKQMAITTFLCLLFCLSLAPANAQSKSEKIDQLIALEYDTEAIDQMMTMRVKSEIMAKRSWPVSSDFDWVSLEKNAVDFSKNYFKSLLYRIYDNNYTDAEIDYAIEFRSSKIGQSISEKNKLMKESVSIELRKFTSALDDFLNERLQQNTATKKETEEVTIQDDLEVEEMIVDDYVEVEESYSILFDIDKPILKSRKLKNKLSDPYIFTIKNIGSIDFFITDIQTDVNIAYLNYDPNAIRPNEETEIRVVISKSLLNKADIENIALQLNVRLKENRFGKIDPANDEILKLKIE